MFHETSSRSSVDSCRRADIDESDVTAFLEYEDVYTPYILGDDFGETFKPADSWYGGSLDKIQKAGAKCKKARVDVVDVDWTLMQAQTTTSMRLTP